MYVLSQMVMPVILLTGSSVRLEQDTGASTIQNWTVPYFKGVWKGYTVGGYWVVDFASIFLI